MFFWQKHFLSFGTWWKIRKWNENYFCQKNYISKWIKTAWRFVLENVQSSHFLLWTLFISALRVSVSLVQKVILLLSRAPVRFVILHIGQKFRYLSERILCCCILKSENILYYCSNQVFPRRFCKLCWWLMWSKSDVEGCSIVKELGQVWNMLRIEFI